MVGDYDDRFLEKLAELELSGSEPAPPPLKARIYSAMLRRQAESGSLASLTETKLHGQELCVFEQLVRIAPIGEKAKSLNICRICHARVLAEHLDNAPIFWNGCPYVRFKRS